MALLLIGKLCLSYVIVEEKEINISLVFSNIHALLQKQILLCVTAYSTNTS